MEKSRRLTTNIIQFNLEKKYIKIYKSIAEAARKLNGSESNIRRCLEGINPTAFGYKWDYSNISFYNFEPDLLGEEWKFLSEFCLKVSNKERIQFKDGTKTFGCPYDRGDGRTYFKIGNKKNYLQVHRLIGIAWVYNPDPENFKIIDHIGGTEKGNFPENLLWTNSSGNRLNSKDNKYN